MRSYREPDVPHPLQVAFLDEASERNWIEEIRCLLSAGDAEKADDRLRSALDGFDGALACLCKATPASDVTIDGWDDLLPILDEWEGPAITAITVGLTNPSDLVFEAGQAKDPELLLGLYSDEAFPFASSTKADLLKQCEQDMPRWIGAEEDVEFYCETRGLAALNTALVQCKHRHFLRDGKDGVKGRAPGGYVEFVLASWLLATRFLQAAQRAAKRNLPDGCRLIVGTVDLNADFAAVLGPDQPLAPAAPPAALVDNHRTATLTVKPWVSREELSVDALVNGGTLRQRLKSMEPGLPSPTEARGGILARLFGRLKRG